MSRGDTRRALGSLLDALRGVLRVRWMRLLGILVLALLGLRIGLTALLARALDAAVEPHGLALGWDSLSLGLLDLDARLRGLELSGRGAAPEEEPLLELEYAVLDVDTWRLLHGELRVLRAEVDGLEVTLLRDEEGHWNLDEHLDLAELLAAPEEAPAEEPAPGPEDELSGRDLSPPLDLAALRFQAARLRVVDRFPAEPVELDLRLNAALSRLGLYERPTRFSVDVTGGDVLYGASLVGSARSSADRLEVDFRGTLGALQPDELAPYLAALGLEPAARSISGTLRGRAALEVIGEARDGLGLELELADTALSADGTEELALDALELRVEERADGWLVPQPVEVRGLRGRLELRPDGAVRVAGLALLPVPVHVEAPGTSSAAPAPPPQAAGEPAALLRLAGLRLEGGRLEFLDRSVAPPADLVLLCRALELGALELGPGAADARVPLRVELAVPGAIEALTLDAGFDLRGAERDLLVDLTASGFDLAAIEPYLAGSGVEQALEGGELRLHGEVRTRHESGEPLHLELELADLSLAADRELFAVRDLVLRDTYFDLASGHLKLGGLTLDGLTSGLRLEPGGAVSALGLRFGATAEAPPAPPSGAPSVEAVEHPLLRWIDVESLRAAIPPVDLGRVEVTGTSFVLEDATVTPPRSLVLDDLGLALEGLVLGLPEGAPVEPAALRLHTALEGLLEDLSLVGTITTRPGRLDLETDLVLAARGIDGEALVPFTRALGVEPLLRAGELGLRLDARLQEPEVDVWRADLTLEDLRLIDGETRWLGLERLALEGVRSDGERLEIESIAVVRPEASVERDADGGLRAAGMRLLPASGSSPAAPPATAGATPASAPTLPDLSGLPPLQVRDLRVDGVRLRVRDGQQQPPLEAELTLDLGLSAINTLGDPVGVLVRAGVRGLVEAVELETEVRLGERRIDLEGRFGVRGLDPAGLAAYLPAGLALESGQARLDGRLALGVGEAEAGGLTARAELGAVRGGVPAEPAWLEVDRLALEARRLDPAAARHELGELTLAGTRLRVARDGDGALRALGLRITPAAEEGAANAAPELAGDEAGDGDPPLAAETADAAPVAPAPPPTVVLLEPVELELERLELADAARPADAPALAGGARLRIEPGVLLQPRAEELPSVAWSVEAGLEGVVEALRLEASTTPFATQPSARFVLSAEGLSTRELTRRLPQLAAVAEGELDAGELHAVLEATLDVQRTRAFELGLQRPFSGSLRLSEVRLLDGPGGEVLLGVDEVTADLGRVDLAQGRVLVEDLEVDTPRALARREEAGIHAGGFLWRADGAAPVDGSPEEAAARVADAPSSEDGAASTEELRIDSLYVGGLDVRVTDESVAPPLALHLADLDLDVRRFSTRALAEPRSISYRAYLACGGDRPLFEDLSTRGLVTLFPRPEGWARTELNGLELPLLTGYTEPSGVKLRGGTLRVVSGTNLAGERMTVNTSLRFDELSIHEQSGGPIERALKLPMNLNNALFLTRSPDGSHRIGIDLALTPRGLSYGQLLGQVTGAVALFFTQALAGAPVRLLTSVSPLDMKRGPRAPLEVVEVEFAPGRTRLDDAQLAEMARLGRRLAERPDLRVTVTYEAGDGDDAEAERLANPSEEECLELVRALRRRRAELWRAIGERKLEARALFAIGSGDALEEVAALREMERKLAELEEGLERVLAVLDADSARQRERRTKRLLAEIAELRLQEVQLGLQRRMKPYQYGQIERKPVRLRERAEGRPGRVRVELSIP